MLEQLLNNTANLQFKVQYMDDIKASRRKQGQYKYMTNEQTLSADENCVMLSKATNE